MRTRAAVVALAAAVACAAPRPAPPPDAPPELPTIEDRVAQYGPRARVRLAPYFAAAGIAYPPARFVLVALKHERELHLLAAGDAGAPAFVRAYAIHGASGELGPKLRRGDLQVPEGVYAIEYLNPNSVAHLSLALGYPNAFDRSRAAADGRDDLGGDIMIHGGAMSHGCLAMGDEAAEDLFVLAADGGFDDAVVVVSPVDFRRRPLPRDYHTPVPWVLELYAALRDELAALPAAPDGAAVTEAP